VAFSPFSQNSGDVSQFSEEPVASIITLIIIIIITYVSPVL
jgi:hypothetical protein